MSKSLLGSVYVTYPPTIASVRAIKPRVSFTLSKNNTRVGLYHLPFLALLVYFFRECYETSGKPYRIAMEVGDEEEWIWGRRRWDDDEAKV
jgi:hypothetical protein